MLGADLRKPRVGPASVAPGDALKHGGPRQFAAPRRSATRQPFNRAGRGINHLGIVAEPRAETAEEAGREAAQGRFPVGVVGIELGEQGKGDPVVAALEQRDLVVDPTAAAPPPALQVERPAGRHDAADPPALSTDDVREQVARVGPVVLGM
jgi:hypothetical protein